MSIPQPSEQDHDRDAAVTRVRATTSQDSRFAAFWAAYPRKKSKGAAEKAWRTLKLSEPLHDRIMNALERATTSQDWQRDGGQFIPYPATWLRAKGWEDEGVTGHAAGGVLTANLGPEVET